MIGETYAEQEHIYIQMDDAQALKISIHEAINISKGLGEAIRSACEYKYYGEGLSDMRNTLGDNKE